MRPGLSWADPRLRGRRRGDRGNTIVVPRSSTRPSQGVSGSCGPVRGRCARRITASQESPRVVGWDSGRIRREQEGARRGRDAVPPGEGPDLRHARSEVPRRARLRQFLHDVWHGTVVGSHGVITLTSADGPDPAVPTPTGPQRLAHRCARSGSVSTVDGGRSRMGNDRTRYRPADHSPTGYWSALLRRRPLDHGRDDDPSGGGLSRRRTACDPPTAPMPADTRHWPVEFFWKCGQPRFEGWVTWRDEAEGGPVR